MKDQTKKLSFKTFSSFSTIKYQVGAFVVEFFLVMGVLVLLVAGASTVMKDDLAQFNEDVLECFANLFMGGSCESTSTTRRDDSPTHEREESGPGETEEPVVEQPDTPCTDIVSAAFRQQDAFVQEHISAAQRIGVDLSSRIPNIERFDTSSEGPNYTDTGGDAIDLIIAPPTRGRDVWAAATNAYGYDIVLSNYGYHVIEKQTNRALKQAGCAPLSPHLDAMLAAGVGFPTLAGNRESDEASAIAAQILRDIRNNEGSSFEDLRQDTLDTSDLDANN